MLATSILGYATIALDTGAQAQGPRAYGVRGSCEYGSLTGTGHPKRVPGGLQRQCCLDRSLVDLNLQGGVGGRGLHTLEDNRLECLGRHLTATTVPWAHPKTQLGPGAAARDCEHAASVMQHSSCHCKRSHRPSWRRRIIDTVGMCINAGAHQVHTGPVQAHTSADGCPRITIVLDWAPCTREPVSVRLNANDRSR